MAKSAAPIVLDPEALERRIHVVRGHRVMLDFDLARLYGVSTKALNQAVKRHPERFPADFAYQLTPQDVTDLRSQIVTANPTAGKRRYQPWAFTEHGVAMLSSVLRSPRAIAVNIAIMRAFVRIRRLLATSGEIVAQLNELAKSVQLHEHQIKTIADVLRRMMEPQPPEPAPAPPKPRIGFRPELRAPYSLNGQPERGTRR